MALVYLDGALLEQDAAQISVFDHGFVTGDGVFETLLLQYGRPFALRRHLDRLEVSAKGLGITVPPRETIASAIDAVAAASGLEVGRIRVTLSAGIGPLGSHRLSVPPCLVVACEKADLPSAPARLAVVPWTRNEHGATAGLKTTSYAENVRALDFAERRGADEAIFANTAGRLCEGTGSNIFFIRDGTCFTPPLASGCLAGVTRALVIESFAVIEIDSSIDEFKQALLEEAFVTSSVRGVQPVGEIDGATFSAVPGRVTKEVMTAYEALAEESPDP